MSNDSKKQADQRDSSHVQSEPSPRRPYEAPRVMRKRSIARVTLTSGSGGPSVGLISTTN